MTQVYLMISSQLYNKDDIITIHNSDSKSVINEKAFLSVSGEKKAEELSKYIKDAIPIVCSLITSINPSLIIISCFFLIKSFAL